MQDDFKMKFWNRPALDFAREIPENPRNKKEAAAS
jgi:hypothetical protein